MQSDAPCDVGFSLMTTSPPILLVLLYFYFLQQPNLILFGLTVRSFLPYAAPLLNGSVLFSFNHLFSNAHYSGLIIACLCPAEWLLSVFYIEFETASKGHKSFNHIMMKLIKFSI